MWWSWFGPLYRPLVAAQLTTGQVTPVGEGLLHQAADEPADRDQLAPSGWLSPDLLATPDTSDLTVFNPHLTPALTLPPQTRAGDVPAGVTVTRHAVGLEVRGGEVVVLIEAGRTLPATQTELFTTADEDQLSLTIRVMRDDNATPPHHTPLGRYEISGFQPGRPGTTRIAVTFHLDHRENLTVTAKDLNGETPAVVRRQP